MTEKINNRLYLGDCLDILPTFPEECVDLIITSPPYACQRKKTYGGISPDKYIEWYMSIASELQRVLKKDGTFILNIKENVVKGERSTYVLELILALKKQGWLWTEEYIWTKKNSVPGFWPNRFRDAWERCLQFNKNKKFNMYQKEVMVPVSEATKYRMKHLGKNDYIRTSSKTNSGFGRRIANWVGREKCYPTNVLHFSTESTNRNHSAAFPRKLPEWFIKLFSKEDDVVLDPFVGSGTTCLAAQMLNRKYIGIEVNKDYYNLAKKNILPCLF